MKKYVMLAFAAILSLGITISAQDQTPPLGGQGGPGGQRGQGMQFTPKERADRLAKQLNLTDEEKAKVEELYKNQDARREKMKQEMDQKKNDKKSEIKEDQEKNRAKYDEQRKADDEDLLKIIGKEKFEKYQTMRTERQNRMRERGGNGNGSGNNNWGGQHNDNNNNSNGNQ